MRSKIIFLLSILYGLFTPFASAQSDVTSSIADTATTLKQIKAAPNRGALYRISYQGNTTYLFGTIHVGKPTFFPLETQVTDALTHATKLVVEFDIMNAEPLQKSVQKYGMYAADDTVEKHLSPAGFGQLKQILEKLGLPYEKVAQMKPWLLANLLVSLELERGGYQRGYGVEVFLLSFAKAQTKIIQELETADYQLSLFDGMAAAEQEQYLHENLAQIADGEVTKNTEELINAWGNANATALEEMRRKMASEKSTTSDFTQHILLDKRNLEMADKIEVLLKNDKATFVGVGLLHLLGANGLPALLQQRGYAVQKLY